MSPRKQVNKDASAFSSGRDGDCVEAEDTDDEMFPEERPHSSLSLSTREKCRRERDVKAKPREMTEEEMMDLALRLSEQEASIAAVKRQQEEEAMMEALKESMYSQTQPCASPQSQSYHGNTDPSPKLPSRRKLAYPAMACKDVVLVEDLATEASVEYDSRGAGDHKHNKRKRKMEDGAPLLELPDLSQTQKISSQTSTLDPLSSQDFSSTQTDPCRLPKTFKPPSSAINLQVQLPRMNRGTLMTCRTFGFVLCSQQSLTSTQTPQPSPSKSPTFPSSATHSDNLEHSKKPTFPKSTDCSEPDLEEVGETDAHLNCPKSPVFGRIDSTKASNNTGFAPKSPVFGRVVSTRASDYETQIPVSDMSQKLLATCEATPSQESLQISKLCHSKRQIYSASYTLSKGLTFPKSPAPAGNQHGEDEDMLRHSCSVRTAHCRTSPVFGKDSQVIGETSRVFSKESPVFGEASPVFGKTNLPKIGSGRSSPVFGGTSPVFGRTSPVFGRTGTEKSYILSVDRESSSEDSYSASSPHGSAIYNKETRQPPQCLQKTNGVNHEDEESESMSGDHIGKHTTATMAGKEKQTKSDEESIPESMTITSDMNLRCSDDGEDMVQSEMSPSPVFPEESPLQQAEDRRQSPEYRASAGPGTSSHSPKCLRLSPLPGPVAVEIGGSDTTTTTCLQDPQSGAGPSHTQEPSSEVSALPERPRGEPVVHYYWGVPFCPQGLDPDVYTEVILAQMEVYEKSLKHAQRSLPKKAEWGEGITPETEEPLEDSPELIPTRSLNRRGLRSRRKQSGEKLPEEEEGAGGWKEPDTELESVEPVEDGEEDLDVVGCDVCPETQLSGEDAQELMMDTNAGDEAPPDSPSLLHIQSPCPALPPSTGEGEEEDHTPGLDKKEEEAEEDAGGDSEQLAVMSPSREQELLPGQEEEEEETEGALDVQERKDTGHAEAAVAAVSTFKAVSTVDCPICQSAFPASEIEMHAAFCDGEQEVLECAEDRSPVSMRPHKRRTLKSLAMEEHRDPSGHAKPQRREKCFVCHKSVPLAEFSRHTESCIQRQQASTTTPPKGHLLSALETTDGRDAGGPSVSNIACTTGEVIDLSVNDDEEDSEEGGSGQPSTFRISDSPIRAFRSISEAPDCLVDFRRQNAARQPNPRPRGRRGGGGGGGGVKRKFKRR